MLMNTHAPASATVPSHFALALRQHCLSKGAVAAQMRNGKWTMVRYVDQGETNGIPLGQFQCDGIDAVWGLDATCVENRKLDIVYYAPEKDVFSGLNAMHDVIVHKLSQMAQPAAPLWQ